MGLDVVLVGSVLTHGAEAVEIRGVCGVKLLLWSPTILCVQSHRLGHEGVADIFGEKLRSSFAIFHDYSPFVVARIARRKTALIRLNL